MEKYQDKSKQYCITPVPKCNPLKKKLIYLFLWVRFQNGDYKRTVEYMLITCNNCTVIGQKTIYRLRSIGVDAGATDDEQYDDGNQPNQITAIFTESDNNNF
jgi:hypothetical protein